MERLIGRYTEDRDGPLIICVGGMHGNEPAGVKALQLVLKMLEVEPITNPTFEFRGKLLGLRGNMQALKADIRFVDRDLNRIWRAGDHIVHDAEAQEKRELMACLSQEIEAHDGDVVFLDLHTTTAAGGIFTFPHDSALGAVLAKMIGAPVILDIHTMLEGTCASYLTKRYSNVTSMVFEGGQHQEEASVNRMIAAVVSCLRAAKCVDSKHIEHQHDRILSQYSVGLPKMSRVVFRHPIFPGDGFRMHAGYQNFDPVEQGEILADSTMGPVRSPRSGMILMPHYQELGEDGFFIIQELEE